jgi:threonylcarbamoyladenosine tRNA methylthiotransferase MtaB
MQTIPPKKCFYIYTLGCKVNWCDSEAMAAAVIQHGWQRVPDAQAAAVCIVNTCTVTKHADASARKIIRRIRRENLDTPLIVTGCYATTDVETLRAMPEIDRILSCSEETEIARIINEMYTATYCSGDSCSQVSMLKTSEVKNLQPSGDRTRGFIKIQDGCNQFCAYCKIPYARGTLHSRPLNEIMQEAAAHAAAGYKEIVLTGIHIAAYSDSGVQMAGLLKKLAEEKLVPRIRVSSLEAKAVTDELLDVFTQYPSLMPQVHIPLQSGSNKVLKLMSRNVSREEFLRATHAFLEYSDMATVTTDIMVGLPGEEEEDFQQTLDIVDQIPFAKVHIFPFSPREGTAAAKMKELFVPTREIHRREQELAAHARASAERCRTAFVDSVLHVLIERKHEDGWEGFSENYLRVSTRQAGLSPNEIVELPMNTQENSFLAQ